MNASHVNTTLVAIGTAGIVLGVRLAAWPLVNVTLPATIGTPSTASPTDASGQPESLGAALVERDPFRVARRAAAVLYDPMRLAQPSAPRPPIPAIALVGIVWDNGRDPTALMEGIPGVDGPRPVQGGDTVGGLRVRKIMPDRVVITGFDTTWTLTVREPWR